MNPPPRLKAEVPLRLPDPLAEGLSLLCDNDPDIAGIVAPRQGEIMSLLAKFIDEIERRNPALSLVGASDRRELVVRHMLDSLAALGIMLRKCDCQHACDNLRIADIGSGAGLPGIPLAIALPNSQFTLIERMGRRAGFLREVQASLGLANVTVEEQQMERTKPGRFSLVTFRAFRPLEAKIYKKLSRLCCEGGVLAAYKGRHLKAEAEMASLQKALPALAGRWELVPCPVPLLDEERHILLIRKNP